MTSVSEPLLKLIKQVTNVILVVSTHSTAKSSGWRDFISFSTSLKFLALVNILQYMLKWLERGQLDDRGQDDLIISRIFVGPNIVAA